MSLANPMDTPVPYQCISHKCMKRVYDKETFSTLRVIGTKVKGRHSTKILREWIIMTCPHCKETYPITLTADLYRICPFQEIEQPEYG